METLYNYVKMNKIFRELEIQILFYFTLNNKLMKNDRQRF